MPKLKLGNKDVAPEATGFGVYEGPEPRNGSYNAVIKQMRMKESKAGNLYFNMLLEFVDNEGEKEPYNGYPLWHMLTPGDSDLQQTRLSQLLVAVTGKREAAVDYNDLDAKEEPGKVTKIGGKNPIDTKVKVVVNREKDNREPDNFQIRVSDMFPRSGGTSAKTISELETDEEPADIDDEGAVDPDGVNLDELRGDLEGLTLAKLKAYAKENTNLETDDLKGLKAPAIIDLILEQFSEDEGEGEDEDEDAEADAEDTEDALRDELAELSVPDLKKRAKSNGATVKDLKGLDSDDLVSLIVSQEAPADEGDEDGSDTDEEGRLLYSAALRLERDDLIQRLVDAGYDAEDFEDEDEYGQEELVDTLVEEDLVGPKAAGPF